MVKILHIVGDSKYGGGSKVILQLAQMAQKEGWEVDVLTTDPVFQEKLREKEIGVVSLDCIWRPIRPVRDLLGLLRLYRYLRTTDYTLVHTHTSKAGFIGRAAAWYAKVPIIIHTVHGFAFHEESSPLALKVYSTLEKIAAHWCHCLVTVSHFHRDWALHLGIGIPEQIVAIPNGISESDIQPKRNRNAIRTELGIGPEDIMLLTMGRLAPQKGIEYLIEGIDLLKKRLSALRVVACIVGEGPSKVDLKERAESLGLEKDGFVRFLGFREEIGDFLTASDIVVLPSLWEGLSIALLEAMAAGKAILTTNIGSNLEVTDGGRTAIIIPPKDSRAIAKNLLRLIKNKEECERLGFLAKERYMKFYHITKTTHLYKSLYKANIC